MFDWFDFYGERSKIRHEAPNTRQDNISTTKRDIEWENVQGYNKNEYFFFYCLILFRHSLVMQYYYALFENLLIIVIQDCLLPCVNWHTHKSNQKRDSTSETVRSPEFHRKLKNNSKPRRRVQILVFYDK